MRVILVIAMLALVGCTSAAPNEPSAPVPDPPRAQAASPDALIEQLAGGYRYAGTADERRSVVDEIDQVAGEMGFLAAGIARKRLRASNAIPERVSITRQGDKLTIELDDRSYTGSVGGAATDVEGVTGDTLSMRFVVSKGTLEQRFVGEDGGRVNSFTTGGDGEMHLAVRVFSERLPSDVRYVLTYRALKP